MSATTTSAEQQEHGTIRGWKTHNSRCEQPCEPCANAAAAGREAIRIEQEAQKTGPWRWVDTRTGRASD